MPYTIRIEGLDRALALLNPQIEPALQAATKAIALEVQNVIAPYPPATAANDSGQARWYERGFGSRWRRKDGSIGGSKTSEMLNRSWAIRAVGRWGASVGSRASYAPFVHSKDRQARALQRIGWKTDEAAISQVLASGVVRRIVSQALVFAMRRR
jgi:hypothetical protein